MKRTARCTACLVLVLSLVLAGSGPGLAASLAINEIRPGIIRAGATTEITLVGYGFGSICRVWVRAPDLAEQQIPGIPRSLTEFSVLVGGELTARPRSLEFQVRCSVEADTGERVERSHWRALEVRTSGFVPPPGQIIPMMPGPVQPGQPGQSPSVRPGVLPASVPAAPSRLRIDADVPVVVRWYDNSTNEIGFYVYVDGQRWLTIVSSTPGLTGERTHQTSLDSLAGVLRAPRCGRDIELAIAAFGPFGESQRATTAFRWRLCQ